MTVVSGYYYESKKLGLINMEGKSEFSFAFISKVSLPLSQFSRKPLLYQLLLKKTPVGNLMKTWSVDSHLRLKKEREECCPFKTFLILKGLAIFNSCLKEVISFHDAGDFKVSMMFREIITDYEIYRKQLHYVGKKKSLSKVQQIIYAQYLPLGLKR